jgi:tol-pal system protein YbgF
MTQTILTAPAALARAVLVVLTIALVTGCSDTSPSSGNEPPSQDFELRAMIASDRAAINSLDVRLRRMEDQIQELTHGGAPVASAPAAPPPAQSAPPPDVSNPGAQAPPPANPLGAPPAPEAAAAPPPAAAAPPENPASGGSETNTIANAPESPGDENAGTANAPEGNAADEGASDEGAAAGGNPETNPAGGPPAPPANPGEGAASAGGGEETASVAPSAPPENAPAAIPPPRWPQDLAQQLQSSASAKGGAGNLYRSGLEAMKNRDYSAAVDRFQTIEKKYPHSDLIEPAAYFSANALNEQGKYDQAILQYNDLVMRYPKGKYSGEALLRESQAFVQINDKVDARLTLQKLMSEHPGTQQAATANAMMQSLESD